MPLAALATVVLCLAAHPSQAETSREWNFRVSLDGTPIGSQVFREIREQDRTKVTVEADLDVRVLFFSAYTYEHRNEETWKDGCLVSMRSTTDDNGKPYEVLAQPSEDGLDVRTLEGREQVTGCVSSFAYWKPEALGAPRLLNSQNGQWQEVSLLELGKETLTFRGKPTTARRLALVGKELRIDLWYADDDEWLALESTLSNGRKLSYTRL